MQNYQIKTIRYQTHFKQQGSAIILAAIALLVVAVVYFLFTRWGWGVVVGALIIAGISGLAALEFAMREQRAEDGYQANHVEAANQRTSKAPAKKTAKTTHSTHADHADVEHTLNIDNSDLQATLEENTPPLIQPQPTAAMKQYRLEMVNPGKEPVQVMRVLHNDFGFPADKAKRVIMDQLFPVKLGQGGKDLMQERARGLLKAGAKLRLVHCRADAGAVDNGSAAQMNQRAI